MKKHSKKINRFIITLFVLLWAKMAHAEGGFRTPIIDAAALGKVGGNIAFIDDLSAMKHNPANLTEQKKPAVLGGVGIIYLSREYTAPDGKSDKQPHHWILMPHLFAATPIGSQTNIVFGIGLSVSQGLATSWSKEGPLRYHAPYSAENQAFDINPTLAVKLTETLSVGIGINFLQAELGMRQFYPWVLITPGLPDGQMRFDAKGHGWGGNVAVTWDVTSRQRLALVYKMPIKVKYHGDFKISNFPNPAPANLPSGTSSRSDFHTGIKYPGSVALGYGIQLSETLQLGIDFRWAECSSVDTLPVDIEQNNALLPADQRDIRLDWKDTWDIGFGIDWKATSKWNLRAGYAFYERPTKNKTWFPLLTEYDRHTFSLGAGYTHKSHKLDLGLAYAYYKPLKIKDNQISAFNGTYKASMIIGAGSYAYNF